MTESVSPKEPRKVDGGKSKIQSFLSRPAIAILGFISAVVGLISLPLSIYFYYSAKEYPQLSYHVSPSKAVVVRAGQASKLTASYDNKVITTDITAAQVALWNGGTKTIKSADVLKPVTLRLENNTPILEATVRKASREVIRLELGTQELQEGRVSVSWNLLERGDGGVVQLIYAGDPNVNISADGVIEGQPQIVQQTMLPAGIGDKVFMVFAIIAGLFGLFLNAYMSYRFKHRVGISDVVLSIIFLFFLLSGLYYLYLTTGTGPPFDI